MDELARQLSVLAGNSPVQLLTDPFPEPVDIRLYLKRDDLLHPLVSGNKWRKLKHNLLEARREKTDTLLTFGGAYSNHLYATAAAGKVFGFTTIGVVRGEELAKIPRNATLAFCESCGMILHFVSRQDYKRKDDSDFLGELREQFGACYVVPEGGTNDLAIRGTSEIMPELIEQLDVAPDFVCCAVGTGGTMAGLVQTASPETTVFGFLSLKAPEFDLPIQVFGKPYRLETGYSFGGYARTTPELIRFIQAFEQKTGVLIEQVYTGKLLFGIYDLARSGYFPSGSTVVALHTGGLQGRSPALDVPL
ncbi:pyridoxal-phosphate dependent enzyme [Spirosoma terrae]|uniref:1-aminocyclopropane-1-carboxylate deaminase/D-cysteine desulfhydrase n=1 Tax=Spirosoma terrae TaxID=1968276 RepID=A0A6L9L602_9BACT|nr:pyridoxal-phosphate dependent enzyme [Spirosoma terrae]NDU96055.1 1-aminocyclopropane-1-carboxylate deaminase/D-cysteine desulfhydrase [Spirosoma terrae]